ncbi:MAG: radical SAM family heme chaperone HemW [Parachlamydiales bacterium]|jgi:oxygen-independent coproporphyrinogen-3 oxidase
MPITGNDLSLYFHVPFCIKKCPYCHFYSIFYKDEFEKAYIEAIKLHINLYKEVISSKNIVSIYFGGGTPSLLSIKGLNEILKQIPFDKSEITIEINPEDITEEKISAYKSLGINRVSIGAQSFDDDLLKVLQRRHDSKKSKKVIDLFYNHGIKNISIDLMYDIMYQDLLSWKKTLAETANLPITHISLYNLTFEENTLFYKNKENLSKFLPDENLSLSLLNSAIEEFEKMGFERYEISAFAKNNLSSVHNLGYWQGRDFLGFGPSAFSYFESKRFRNICNLKKYLELLKDSLSPIDFEEKLLYPDNINELLAINLRIIKGVDINDFEKKFGKIPQETISILKKSSLVEFQNNFIKMNKNGLLFYDTLASEII